MLLKTGIAVILLIAVSAAPPSSRSHTDAYLRHDLLIRPGIGVGPLQLGVGKERVFALFPRKLNVDQEILVPNCGSPEYDWANLDRLHGGSLSISIRHDIVSEIEVSTDRGRTREGIAPGDSPLKVRRYFGGLKAFALRGGADEALGDRTLTVWVDSKKGIAFAFAWSRRLKARRLYSIIVFKPESPFCVDDTEMDNPQNWWELKPYSLESAAIPD